ncbi:hypothetical protein LL560_003491 [Salmonella enterica]|nr:hypothetical protein [Salmonella enterica]
MIESVRLQTSRNMEWMDADEMVTRLNQKLGGWTNYFRLGPVTQSYRFIGTANRKRRKQICLTCKITAPHLDSTRFPSGPLID